ncbi:MAG: hypothetical protein V3T90_16060, partial [Anaerolineae bacterium]
MFYLFLRPLALGDFCFQGSISLLQLHHLAFQLADEGLVVLSEIDGFLLHRLARRDQPARLVVLNNLLHHLHKHVWLRRLDDEPLCPQAEGEL